MNGLMGTLQKHCQLYKFVGKTKDVVRLTNDPTDVQVKKALRPKARAKPGRAMDKWLVPCFCQLPSQFI